MEIPKKTRNEYQATFGGLCAAVITYNEQNLIFGKVQLNSTGMTPGICTWDISHHVLGVLGSVKVIELATGNSVIEVYPKVILTREDVFRSDYGSEIEFVKLQANRLGTEMAMEQSELHFDKVRDKLHKDIFKEYTVSVEIFISGINALVDTIGSKEITEHEQQASKHYQPGQKDLIVQACLKWAGRGYMPGYNMEEFLSEFDADTGIFIGKVEFKKALREAEKNNLIQKVHGRWRPIN